MRILYVDCFSGISGDMVVGALADLGVTPSTFEWELSKIELEELHLHFDRQTRWGIAGVKFDVHSGSTHQDGEAHVLEQHQYHRHETDQDSKYAHRHDECHHHDHHHDATAGPDLPNPANDGLEPKSFSGIKALILKSELSDFVKKRTISIFQRIAEAEGKIHGTPAAEVRF